MRSLNGACYAIANTFESSLTIRLFTSKVRSTLRDSRLIWLMCCEGEALPSIDSIDLRHCISRPHAHFVNAKKRSQHNIGFFISEATPVNIQMSAKCATNWYALTPIAATQRSNRKKSICDKAT